MALQLSAREGSRILIGTDVVLEVHRNGRAMRLWFHANPSLRIVREEVATDAEIERIRKITGTGPPPSATIKPP